MSTYQLKAFGLLAILLAATDTAAFACDATTVDVTHQADVTCYGAVGTGSADDSRAINAAASVAVARHVPLVLPAGRYRVTSPISIDYATDYDTGIEILSQGAIIDGTAITGVSVLYIYCSDGSPANPKGCFTYTWAGRCSSTQTPPVYGLWCLEPTTSRMPITR